jgi:hypothetical protein
MRTIIYGSAIFAAMLAATIAASHLPRLATAASDQANATLDVPMLEHTIDARALPQQEIPDEVYR